MNDVTNPFPRTGALLRRRFMTFLFPTLLAVSAMQLTFVAAGLFVGNLLGPECLAAMNLAIPFLQICVSAGAFFGVGGTVLISLYKGAHKELEASTVFCLAFYGMIFTGLVITCTGLYGHTNIVSFLTGKDPVLTQHLTAYLVPGFIGAPLFILVSGMVYLIRADGRPNLASALMLSANLLNIAFLPIFIILIGNLSAPAWAMIAGYTLASPILAVYFVSRQRTLRLILPRQTLRNVWKLTVNGIPVAAQGLQIPLKVLCVNGLVVMYGGTLGLTAYSIIIACISVTSLCISGVIQTMMPMVGILYGDKDRSGIRFVFGYSFWTLMVSMLILFTLLELFPQYVLLGFGIIEPEMITVGTTAIRLFALAIPGMALAALLRSYAQAIEHPGTAMFIVFLEHILVMLPALWLFSCYFGLPGIWCSFIVAEYAALVPYFLLIASKRVPNRKPDCLLLPTSDILVDATISRNDIDSETCTAWIQDTVRHMVPEFAEQLNQIVAETSASTVDVLIRHSPQNFDGNTVVQFRYDGPPRNPFEKNEIAIQTEYSWILGLNDVRIAGLTERLNIR